MLKDIAMLKNKKRVGPVGRGRPFVCVDSAPLHFIVLKAIPWS